MFEITRTVSLTVAYPNGPETLKLQERSSNYGYTFPTRKAAAETARSWAKQTGKTYGIGAVMVVFPSAH